MEKASLTELRVKSSEPVMVVPSLPSPKTILSLSFIDQVYGKSSFNFLLVYNARQGISADPVKTIRSALAKALVYYYPLAGRLTSKENGELQVECTGEGVLFVEATSDNDLSVLGDLEDLKPSFQQLLFRLPPITADSPNSHLLAMQVTQFACGGFVVGMHFHHSACDGKGAGQFFQSLTKIARGDANPSIEPIWNRELVKAKDLLHLQYYHLHSAMDSAHNLLSPLIEDKLVRASFVINSEILQYIKKEFMEECKESFSTFEIVATLAWRAIANALHIPNNQNVSLLFAVDMRRSINPPLPRGYYGNALGIGSASDTVQDLINGSLLRALKIIKKSRMSLQNAYLTPSMTYPSKLNMHLQQDNIIGLTDWRRVGFNEVDFGWGDATNVSSLLSLEKQLITPVFFIFVQPPKDMPNGIKILMRMPMSTAKAFKIEMESMINKCMDKSIQITTGEAMNF
ncbi:hypothetical protein SUGI_0876630 [Cryptomeria japonica]|uniref:taxadien-5-alpha-ol O-acetyltransferase-like n=1 Tax=Cryptomeria japonica TaxID=3369 RepID=UPI0024147708|nr:taxadien-5-alpha-ol O-acetyltransferase-like [Cryptomeria japonica]GLJ42334.1 hypothetical protein SUGI_0876630 [Cryptomeria japonica]